MIHIERSAFEAIINEFSAPGNLVHIFKTIIAIICTHIRLCLFQTMIYLIATVSVNRELLCAELDERKKQELNG